MHAKKLYAEKNQMCEQHTKEQKDKQQYWQT